LQCSPHKHTAQIQIYITAWASPRVGRLRTVQNASARARTLARRPPMATAKFGLLAVATNTHTYTYIITAWPSPPAGRLRTVRSGSARVRTLARRFPMASRRTRTVGSRGMPFGCPAGCCQRRGRAVPQAHQCHAPENKGCSGHYWQCRRGYSWVTPLKTSGVRVILSRSLSLYIYTYIYNIQQHTYMCVCVTIYIYIYSPAGCCQRRGRAARQTHQCHVSWPLHDIVINNSVWCINYKQGVGGGSYLAQ